MYKVSGPKQVFSYHLISQCVFTVLSANVVGGGGVKFDTLGI